MSAPYFCYTCEGYHSRDYCPAKPEQRVKLLALSAERDEWYARLRAAEQAAYQAGYNQAVADLQREADAAWAASSSQVMVSGPSHAELEVLRYGTGGRSRAGDPRPGDRMPSRKAVA